jgi:glycosyltransferase involved in cell wall biosynthesis
VDDPQISVVVPTHNRCERLRVCLDSLELQTVPPDTFELVVVIDGSTDGTSEMLAEGPRPFSLTVVEQARRGVSAARNAGAQRARARSLLFIDDDVVASPSLVSAHVKAHSARSGIVGVGQIEARIPEDADAFARRRADAWRGHSERLAGRALTYMDAYGGNLSIARSMFEDVGGFAPELEVENDFELAYRLNRAGAEFVFVPNAVVTEDQREDWRAIVADQELRGRVAVELARRYPDILGHPELDGFSGARSASLRRLLARARVSPTALARLVLLISRDETPRRWFDFVGLYAYGHGVKQAGRTRRDG